MTTRCEAKRGCSFLCEVFVVIQAHAGFAAAHGRRSEAQVGRVPGPAADPRVRHSRTRGFGAIQGDDGGIQHDLGGGHLERVAPRRLFASERGRETGV